MIIANHHNDTKLESKPMKKMVQFHVLNEELTTRKWSTISFQNALQSPPNIVKIQRQIEQITRLIKKIKEVKMLLKLICKIQEPQKVNPLTGFSQNV